jgi:hypothetical protein
MNGWLVTPGKDLPEPLLPDLAFFFLAGVSD